jgi:hypothetical protein
MSASGRYGEGLAGEPAMLDFVDWLTTRTNNGVVRWEVKSNVISTKLLGSTLLAEFLILAMPEGHMFGRKFTIRDQEGQQVFRESAAGCGKRVAACAVDRAFVYGVMERMGKMTRLE